MAYDEGLAERIREVLASRGEIVERPMFSSMGFFLNGNMAVAAHADGMIARLGPEDAPKAIEEDGVEPFKPGDKAPMTGWVMIETAVLEDDDALADWVDAALGFAATLPAK